MRWRDKRQLDPISQYGSSNPIGISIDAGAIILGVRPQPIEILFGTGALNNIIILISKYLAPKPNISTLILHRNILNNPNQMNRISLPNRNPTLFQCIILVHNIGSGKGFFYGKLLDFGCEAFDVLYVGKLLWGFAHFVVEVGIT